MFLSKQKSFLQPNVYVHYKYKPSVMSGYQELSENPKPTIMTKITSDSKITKSQNEDSKFRNKDSLAYKFGKFSPRDKFQMILLKNIQFTINGLGISEDLILQFPNFSYWRVDELKLNVLYWLLETQLPLNDYCNFRQDQSIPPLPIHKCTIISNKYNSPTRSQFNPIVFKLNDVKYYLMRSMNQYNTLRDYDYYECMKLYDTEYLSLREKPFIVKFKKHHLIHQEIQGCNKRCNATEQFPVIEDLRPVIVTNNIQYKETFFTGAGSYFVNNQYLNHFCHQWLVQFDKETQYSMCCRFEKLDKKQQEKNWQFIRLSENKFRIIYQILPTLKTFTFIYKPGFLHTPIIPEIEKDLKIPNDWKKYYNDEQSTEFRLNSITFIPSTNELMVILHRKDKSLRNPFYDHYCLYLDYDTFEITRYKPQPVLREIAFKITFVTQVLLENDIYHFMCGILDLTSIELQFKKDDWEHDLVIV